ncbi:leucine-rich repeat protein [Pelagibius sp. Alg239-R121]|uniref:leucine-rich repeat protein n=1 Tax=Pelagibius sp. Alg239-R121 TaxID=2993448 RepID=UPI0024A6B7D4|nr:leucine-rich repeat protein [Pelagibius sp. Alg239-R121]
MFSLALLASSLINQERKGDIALWLMGGRRLLMFAVVLQLSMIGDVAMAAPALPGQKCQTVPLEKKLGNVEPWSQAEIWAWTEICEGRIADFNKRYHETLDPTNPVGWKNGDKDRQITQHFLETVLLHESLSGAVPRQGVRIIGALFTTDIDVASAYVGNDVWLDHSRFEGRFSLEHSAFGAALSLEGSAFEGNVNMNGLEVASILNMNGSSFQANVEMDRLEVASSLLMSDKATFERNVFLIGAKVGRSINMKGSSFEGTVLMPDLEVASHLFMSDQATFKDNVDLRSAKVGGQIDMSSSSFEGAVFMPDLEVAGSLFILDTATFKDNVDLHYAKFGGQIGITGSSFEGTVNMNGLEVKTSLLIHNTATFMDNLTLIAAKIGGQIELEDASFEGLVDMSNLEVKGNLFMSGKTNFKDKVDLRGAAVGGQVGITGSSFEGAVILNGLEVADSLLITDKATFKNNVDLRAAKIGGQIDIKNSAFEGFVSMSSLEVHTSLFIRESATFVKPVNFLFGRVGSNLDLSGATLSGLDLSGTQITGEMRLGSDRHLRTEWTKGSRLVLRNTHAGALQDRIDENDDAWPEELQLDGFVYNRLGGFAGKGAKADMLTTRSVNWYIDWIKRDLTYSPQPYAQLAQVFRAAGEIAKANDILHAGRERERSESTGLSWLGLSLLKWTIGYGLGFRYFQALLWVSLLVVLGVTVLRASGEGRRNGLPWGLSYSLDHLIPVVELRKYHYDEVSLRGWARYYFYAHKLTGYVLASFLIAGLAGLTQS